jgi:hypothetical protein
MEHRMKRADRRQHHYIYKITREDGKFYIGMHSTDNLDDGYFGSGTLLSKSIKKHGKEKHSKVILEYLPTREALKLRERELVNEDLLGDKLCMNLRLGGEGGAHGKEAEMWKRPGFKEKVQSGMRRYASTQEGHAQLSECSKQKYQNNPNFRNRRAPVNSFAGKKHTDETKALMSASLKIAQAGERNSQFGTCWVFKDTAKKIQRQELDEYLSNGFRRGRR